VQDKKAARDHLFRNVLPKYNAVSIRNHCRHEANIADMTRLRRRVDDRYRPPDCREPELLDCGNGKPRTRSRTRITSGACCDSTLGRSADSLPDDVETLKTMVIATEAALLQATAATDSRAVPVWDELHGLHAGNPARSRFLLRMGC
jgi:hypothetical protein